MQAAKRDGRFARFQYTPARAANQKRRLYEQSDAFLEIYRWRAGIEATVSRLKHLRLVLSHGRLPRNGAANGVDEPRELDQ